MFDILNVNRNGTVVLPRSFLSHYDLGIRDTLYFEPELYGFRLTSTKTINSFHRCLLNYDGSIELPTFVLSKIERPRMQVVSLPQDGKGGIILLFKDHNYVNHMTKTPQSSRTADQNTIFSAFSDALVMRRVTHVEVMQFGLEPGIPPGIYGIHGYEYIFGELTIHTTNKYTYRDLTMVFTNTQLAEIVFTHDEYRLTLNDITFKFD